MNRYPVRVRARPDSPSRWLWLAKWLLLIPHYVVLAVLWLAFVVLTVVAYVAVLFTGRYPQGIFEFNVGVLRWNWRVAYYGYQALGTDRYPPFTLAEVPNYPAGLSIDGPPQMPRWRPLVAWLFAVPHWMILAALAGTTYQVYQGDNVVASIPAGVGPVVVLILAVYLLVTGRLPQGLYDLLVGIARWSVRVVAYVALLTAAYPPFRLDQGGTEPDGDPVPPAGPAPGTGAAAPPPTGGGSGIAGKIVALVAGVLLLFPGVGLGAGGTGVLVLDAARDSGGYVTGPAFQVGTQTAAVTAEGVRVQAGDEWMRDASGWGRIRITVTAPAQTPLFLGIAAEDDVDAWLSGTAHDELVNPYDDNDPRYRRATGAVRGLGAPGDQTFWLASASGTGTVVLDWQPADGRFAVVLARTDGTPGVTGGVRVATRVPDLTPFGVGLLAASLAFLAGAFVLIYLGATGLGRRPAGPPSPPKPGPLPPAPPAPPRIPEPAGTGGPRG